MIKSTPAWLLRCLEYCRGGKSSLELLGPPKLGLQPTNCNEIHRNIFVEDVGTDVNVTFSNRSRFRVRQLGEISPHPHKETLPARLLLTRTQARKKKQQKKKLCLSSKTRLQGVRNLSFVELILLAVFQMELYLRVTPTRGFAAFWVAITSRKEACSRGP